MKYKYSKEIYSQLIIGKHINKNIIDKVSFTLTDNQLYKELENHIDEYKTLYESIGFELINEDNSFFYLLRKEDSNKDEETNVDKVQLKEYVLMILIIRFYIETKKPIENLIKLEKGITEKDFQDILKYEKFQDLLISFELKSENIFLNQLISKNILEQNEKKNYVLTNTGQYFLNKLIDEAKKEVNEDESESN